MNNLGLLVGALICVGILTWLRAETFTTDKLKYSRMVSQMSLKHKIGQMTQLDITQVILHTGDVDKEKLRRLVDEWGVGSILNNPYSDKASKVMPAEQWAKILTDIQDIAGNHGPKIPILYGLDSVHGANYIKGATLFPQQIGLAATFNRTIAYESSVVTARDTRAIGIHWDFAPIADIAFSPTFPRVYETFGEDPYLTSEMTASSIIGLQKYVAATMKHFLGYMAPRNGRDKAPSWIPDRYIREYFLPPFRTAVESGVMTAMESYHDVNGVPVLSSKYLLKQILREELGFSGVLITDWDEIDQLHTFHKVASSIRAAIKLVLQQTSMDIAMVPYAFSEYMNIVYSLVKSGEIPESRIDESVVRVLELKERLGLLSKSHEKIYPSQDLIQLIGSQADRSLALEAARESIVLLKNDHATLPLTPSVKHIALVGPTADCLRCLCGGWTYAHPGPKQGEDYVFEDGSSLKKALSDAAAARKVGFTYAEAVDLDGQWKMDHLSLRLSLSRVDKVFISLGEAPYAEFWGDIDDARLPKGQLELVQTIASFVPKSKLVLVLIQGRPRNLDGVDKLVGSIIYAPLPCVEGGQALTEILFNTIPVSGKLPFTYNQHISSGVSPHYRKVTEKYDPLFEFGHGLSYSSIHYRVQLSKHRFCADEELQLTVTVKNNGPTDAKESVLVFMGQKYRSVVPEEQKLVRFEKIQLRNGETKKVHFTFSAKDWSFISGDGPHSFKSSIEPGEWHFRVGDQTGTFEVLDC